LRKEKGGCSLPLFQQRKRKITLPLFLKIKRASTPGWAGWWCKRTIIIQHLSIGVWENRTISHGRIPRVLLLICIGVVQMMIIVVDCPSNIEL
jgi:hypothetical protein